MSMYYFSIETETPDDVGVDLPSVDAARDEAARLISDMVKDHPERLWADGAWQLTVSDDQCLSLFQVTLAVTEAPVLLRPR